MAMSVEQAQHRIEQLEEKVNQLMLRSAASEEEHRRTHAELERSRAQVTTLAGASSKEFRLIDPKSMIPDKLGGGQAWRQWSKTARAYVEMLSPTLAEQLKAVEGRESPIAPDELNQAAVPEQHAAQLSRFLKLRSEGNANTLIEASQARREHPLETWRILSWEYDPKGLGSELTELHDLVSPSKLRAKSIAGLSMAIEAWEEQERRHKERQGVELPEKVRTSILFQLAPEKLSEEILKQATKWTSYTALKEHLHALQHQRTNGPAPMISSIEEEAEDENQDPILTEEGELLRLERRNGKRVAVRTSPGTQRRGDGATSFSPATRTGRNTDCHACGRPGHFRRDCTWAKHKDGGPLRPLPAPKAALVQRRRPAGNLEDGTCSEPSDPVELEKPVGVLELNALDFLPVSSGEEDSDIFSDEFGAIEEEAAAEAIEDWMQDQHLDPWGWCQPCGGTRTQGKVPTLQDLYSCRTVCGLCEKAGVYADIIARQHPEHYIQPPMQMFQPRTPMPTSPPSVPKLYVWLPVCLNPWKKRSWIGLLRLLMRSWLIRNFHPLRRLRGLRISLVAEAIIRPAQIQCFLVMLGQVLRRPISPTACPSSRITW